MSDSIKLSSLSTKIKIEGFTFHTILDSTFIKNQSVPPIGNQARFLHTHLEYELFFISSGQLIVQTDTKRCVFSNGVICIPPNYKHYTLRSSGVYRFLFSIQKKDRARDKSFQLFCKTFFNNTITRLSSNDTMGDYLQKINNYYFHDSIFSTQKIQALLLLLFYELYSQNTVPRKFLPPRQESYFIKIDNLIEMRYMENISLKTLAAELSLSPKQLSRIIRQRYKKTLSELLNDRKMSIAANLLTETDKSIAEIISFLNFNTENYFYSRFKKTYGCTPLQYRKNPPPNDKS